MNVGVTESLRERIRQIFATQISAGLWTNTYAATNADEYFAELTQSYFTANPDHADRQHNGINGPKMLHDYDGPGFALMEEVYLTPSDLR